MKKKLPAIAVVFLLLSACASSPLKQARRIQVEKFFSNPQHKDVLSTRQMKRLPKTDSPYYYYILSSLNAYDGSTLEAKQWLEEAITLNDKSSVLQLEMAYRDLEVNQVEEALHSVAKAIELDDKNAEAHLLLGKLYIAQKRNAEAIEQFEKVILLNPKDEESYIFVAKEYLTQKKEKMALQVLARLNKANPESSLAPLYRGLIFSALKDKKSQQLAVIELRDALYKNPDETRAMQALAQIYLGQGKREEAIKLYENMAAISEGDAPLQVRLGLLYYEKQDYKSAIVVFKKVLKRNPKADRIQYYLGILHQTIRETDEALKYFSQVPVESTYYKDAILREVYVYQQLGKNDIAAEVVKKAISKKNSVSEFYDVYGNLLINQKKLGDAIAFLEEATKKFVKDDKLHFSLAVAYDKQGDLQKSSAVMRRVIEINPKNAEAYNYMAYTFAEKGIHLDEALHFAKQAVLLKPQDGYILDSLGWVYFKRGDYEQAQKTIQKAIQLNPGEPTILEHYGDVLSMRGERAKAQVFYKKAFKLLDVKPAKDGDDLEDLDRLKKKFYTKRVLVPMIPQAV